MTRKATSVFGVAAGLMLAAGTASADCAAELVILNDQLGLNQGGASGTDTSSSTSTTADTGTTGTTTDTTGTSTTADTGTTGTSDTTTGTTGTIEEASRTGQAMTDEQRQEAQVIMQRAQVFSDSGEEDACINELQKLKDQMNAQQPAQ